MTARTVATWVLALFVFSIPYENGVVLQGVGSVARLIGFAAIAVVVMSTYDRGMLRFRVPSLFLVVAVAYMVWSAMSVFWSIVPNVSLGEGASLLQLVAMVWMIHQVAQTERQRDLLAQAFVVGAYFTIVLALSEFARATDTFRISAGINPNWFAIACAFGIPIAWGLALRAKHQAAFWLNALYPAFAIVAVVLSASRGGLITMLVALTIIPLTLPRLGIGKRMAVVVAMGLFVVGSAMYAPRAFPGLEQNIVRLKETTAELDGGTFTGRTTIWAAGMDAFWSSPLVGVGAGSFRYAVEERLGLRRAAHNAYLSVAVASGLIGLLLFLSLIATATLGVLMTRARRLELLVLIATLFVGMIPANLEGTKSVWFLLSWIAATRPLLLTPLEASARSRSPMHVSTPGPLAHALPRPQRHDLAEET
ncbi:MAG: O-antigen ligase family protein [Gemmatimonadaceae bacterium]|nr:O-antigen ligase family protein [Gemmatimonadaceae bacterium]